MFFLSMRVNIGGAVGQFVALEPLSSWWKCIYFKMLREITEFVGVLVLCKILGAWFLLNPSRPFFFTNSSHSA